MYPANHSRPSPVNFKIYMYAAAAFLPAWPITFLRSTALALRHNTECVAIWCRYELSAQLAYDLDLASGPEEDHIHLAHHKVWGGCCHSPMLLALRGVRLRLLNV